MDIATNKMSDAGSKIDIIGDNEGCMPGSKQDHTKLAASDLFNNPCYGWSMVYSIVQVMEEDGSTIEEVHRKTYPGARFGTLHISFLCPCDI